MPVQALSNKDVNAPVGSMNMNADPNGKADVKSMEYHRQVFQNKMAQEKYENHYHQVHHQDIVHGTSVTQPEDKKTSQKTLYYHQATDLTRNPLDRSKQYISPSDNIMSPCTAKLTALRNKQIGKAKPKSLFAQTSSKKLDGGNLFGAKPTSATNPDAF